MKPLRREETREDLFVAAIMWASFLLGAGIPLALAIAEVVKAL